jgi:hypothetical protein
MSDMDLMGMINNNWGVCGFTSTFYAMHELNPGTRAGLIGAGIASRVLAEIKTYFMLLKAEGNVTLIKEIETFTKSFGVVNKNDFRKFTIESYIARVNDAVNQSDRQIRRNGLFGVGMPPRAVADYLLRIWGYRSEIVVTKGGDGGTEAAIIGVTKRKMKLYDGLCHYMYRSGGKIYSWGNVYSSVREAGAEYSVCRIIKIKTT